MKQMMEEQKEEMLRDKWIESEKAGRDLGMARMIQWTKEHGAEFRAGYNRRHLMETLHGQPVQYFGIFLDEQSKLDLKETFGAMIPGDWKLYMDHVTIFYGNPLGKRDDIVDYLAWHLGTTTEIHISTFGASDDAMAVGVYGSFPCNNAKPHITLAVPQGGKPVNSNKIKSWAELKVDFTLKGIVDTFPRSYDTKVK